MWGGRSFGMHTALVAPRTAQGLIPSFGQSTGIAPEPGWWGGGGVNSAPQMGDGAQAHWFNCEFITMNSAEENFG